MGLVQVSAPPLFWGTRQRVSVFQTVVPAAQHRQVVDGRAPGRERLGVVQVASGRWLPAAGKPAGAVSCADVVGESAWGTVGGAPDIEHSAGERVGDPSEASSRAVSAVIGPYPVRCRVVGHIRSDWSAGL